MDAIYNRIGDNYDCTRKADPEIINTLIKLINPQSHKQYIDIACGTGNYTVALAQYGGIWSAFDNSDTMLNEAKQKNSQIDWYNCSVESTSFNDNTFDGAICTLAIHHFNDLSLAFKEIARILKPRAKLVIFTSTPEQMANYWLNNYFPEMMKKSCSQMPPIELLKDNAKKFQLGTLAIETFTITPTLQDFFLYSGKYEPAIYFSEKIRKGISSFRNFCSEEELRTGLKQLSIDINEKKIDDFLKNQHPIGDYVFITFEKLDI